MQTKKSKKVKAWVIFRVSDGSLEDICFNKPKWKNEGSIQFTPCTITYTIPNNKKI